MSNNTEGAAVVQVIASFRLNTNFLDGDTFDEDAKEIIRADVRYCLQRMLMTDEMDTLVIDFEETEPS